MSDRLGTALEVAALCRSVESSGGFATVVRKGDPDRGELLIQILQRGQPFAMLERHLAADFTYRWTVSPVQNADWASAARDRTRIDPDLWLMELDVADAERFVAEMIATG